MQTNSNTSSSAVILGRIYSSSMLSSSGHKQVETSQETLLSLAQAYPHDPKHLHTIIIPQLTHRLRLASLWSVAPSSRVLDIGCGQGDSALVLAHVVGLPDPAGPGAAGPDGPGHVTALDPAPGDYGSPYTLAQAQSHILSSEYGSRIAFHQADGPSYLASHPDERFDCATLCHSLWYFSSREAVASLFEALHSSNRIQRVCFAEYSLKSSAPSQVPHELAVEAQKRFHALRENRGFTLHQSNVRGALGPEELTHLAERAGWKLLEKGMEDSPGLLDGQWEVRAVLDPSWKEEVLAEKLGLEAEDELLGCIDRIQAVVDEIKQKGDQVATMDVVWVVMQRGCPHFVVSNDFSYK